MHGDSHRRYIFSFPAFVRLFCVLRFLDLFKICVFGFLDQVYICVFRFQDQLNFVQDLILICISNQDSGAG